MKNPEATLVFIVDGKNVLLAMKKRGFGQGKWNGPGGKLDEGESVENAAVRECYEEVGVKPHNLEKVARLKFIWEPDSENTHERVFYVTAFMSTKYDGDATETEEMKPRWFAVEDIPYDDMWPDDKLWLPKVLGGKHIEGTFWFNEANELTTHKMKAVDFS